MPSEIGANLPWNFPFKRSYWSGGKQTRKAAGSAANEQQRFASQPGLAVSIRNLRKVFETTEGVPKAAVDGLSLDISQGEITALLGAPRHTASSWDAAGSIDMDADTLAQAWLSLQTWLQQFEGPMHSSPTSDSDVVRWLSRGAASVCHANACGNLPD